MSGTGLGDRVRERQNRGKPGWMLDPVLVLGLRARNQGEAGWTDLAVELRPFENCSSGSFSGNG